MSSLEIEQKQAELSLLKSTFETIVDDINSQKQELELIIDDFDQMVIYSRTDLRGLITHVSEAFCKISGYEPEELIGKPHSIMRHPETPTSIFNDVWQALQKEQAIKVEFKNLTKQGSFYWVESHFKPDYNRAGELIGYSATRQDITDKKALEILSKNLELKVDEAVREIEATQREVVFRMGAIAETRSKETGNHVKRVAQYSYLLAKYYGLPEEEARILKEASPMHDIGKVAIPDAILNKPGRFDAAERKIMDTHVDLGYEMLRYSNRHLLKMAAVVAYEHHEKYNGNGYPNQLKGENIHIYGRITALADVFDALGSARVYKPAWDDERIFKMFREERGEHFDPNLIDIFFEHLDEFLEIREKLNDSVPAE